MKYQHYKLVFTLILCTALSSCATLDNVLKPKVDDLLVSPEFVPENFYQGKFLLAPLSSTVADVGFSSVDAQVHTNFFQSYVARKRPGLSVTTFDEISQGIGIANYQALSQEYQRQGFIDNDRLRSLNTLHGIRYVVFANLYDRDVEQTWDEEKDGKHYKVTANTTQEIQVSVNVIDTVKGATVWSGSLNERSSDFEFYKRYPESQKDFGDAAGVLAVIDTVLGDDPRDRYDTTEDQRDYSDRFPAPSPKKVDVLMLDSLEGFVLNLPKLE